MKPQIQPTYSATRRGVFHDVKLELLALRFACTEVLEVVSDSNTIRIYLNKTAEAEIKANHERDPNVRVIGTVFPKTPFPIMLTYAPFWDPGYSTVRKLPDA